MTVDEQLRDLLDRARQPDVPRWEQQKSLNRLLIQVQRLPGILRSTHPEYAIALNQSLEWFCKNLAKFEERPPSLERSLVIWLNGYLKWRIQDLYGRDQTRQKKERSLDTPVNRGGEDSRTLQDLLSDPAPSLSTLEGYIEALQQAKNQHVSRQIQQYIEQDPDGKLVSCHPRNAPHCHCQCLALRILLQEPPARISQLAREFNVNNQTLNSHWKRKCLPLLHEIALRYVGRS